jgi:hypothetical protein
MESQFDLLLKVELHTRKSRLQMKRKLQIAPIIVIQFTGWRAASLAA